MKEYDVVIVGGGIVGLLTALALLQSTALSIALLDEKQGDMAIRTSSYSHRVSAITQRSKAFFSALGVWDAMLKDRVSSFMDIQVWDEDALSALHFKAHHIGKKALGFIIENDVISRALLAALSDYPTFHYHPNTRLNALFFSEKNIRTITSSGDTFLSHLVIGADGAHSKIRELSNISVQCHPYDVAAIVATVKTEKPHDNIARQVFLKTGPLAFLPLIDDHYSSIVWSLPSTLAKEMMLLSDLEFNDALTKAFAHRLGDVTLDSQRYLFPLMKQTAQSYVADRIVLIGDAAHVVHPLAGQGVNLGISDVIALQEVIVSALKNKRNIASSLTLRRYERAAKSAVFTMTKAIDGIHYLFVEEAARLGQLRQAGMKMLQSCEWLKRQVIQAATSR